jgi:RNA polymerase sigma factor (sigma-70 family)
MKPWSTSQFQVCLNRLNDGDPTARVEIIERCLPRVRAICSKMLRSFPALRGKESTQDIFQDTYFRIYRMLEDLEIKTAKDFLQLCAYHIRFTLLDLIKRYRFELECRKELLDTDESNSFLITCSDSNEYEISNLDKWTHFHEAIDQLPTIESTVIGLFWYGGFSQKEVAEILEMSMATVKRVWQLARVNLCSQLGNDLPN